MSLNLGPDLEKRLQGLAAAEGVSLEAFLQHLVEVRAGGAAPPRYQFEEWADSFPNAPLIPDEALSRESLYPDRW
jgi:hypothetical protein